MNDYPPYPPIDPNEELKKRLLGSLQQYQPQNLPTDSSADFQPSPTPSHPLLQPNQPSAIDDYRRLLSSMPEEEKPGTGKKIAGILTGALSGFAEGPTAGVKLGTSVLDSGKDDAINQWKRKVQSSQPALLFDRIGEQNQSRERVAAGNQGVKREGITSRSNDKMAALRSREKIAEVSLEQAKKRTDNQQVQWQAENNLRAIRNEIARESANSQSKVASARAALLSGPITDRVNNQTRQLDDRHNLANSQIASDRRLQEEFVNNPYINLDGTHKPGADPNLAGQEVNKLMLRRQQLLQEEMDKARSQDNPDDFSNLFGE